MRGIPYSEVRLRRQHWKHASRTEHDLKAHRGSENTGRNPEKKQAKRCPKAFRGRQPGQRRIVRVSHLKQVHKQDQGNILAKQAEAEAGTQCLSLKQRPTDGDVFGWRGEGFSCAARIPTRRGVLDSWSTRFLACMHAPQKCVGEQIRLRKGCGRVTSCNRSRSEWVNTSSALVSTSTADATTARRTTFIRVISFFNC